MKVGELCGRNVQQISREEPLVEAIRRFHRSDACALVVVDQAGGRSAPIGWITDRDVLRAQLRLKKDLFALTPTEAMTPSPFSIEASCEVADALGQLRARGVRQALVIDEYGGLVGVIGERDLLSVVAQELGYLAGLAGSQGGE